MKHLSHDPGHPEGDKHVFSENRSAIWAEYFGPKPDTIRHNFCDYDRYFEAGCIASAVGDILQATNRDWTDLRVLDFGCCAGDYGMYFNRLGARSCFVDIDVDALKFVEHRLALEGFRKNDEHHEYHDLTIYGEVLEHCDNAFDILKSDVDHGVEFIFTSSYPFRSDDPNDSYWQGRGHSQQARIDQKKCRELLTKHYDKLNFEGQRNLWVRKRES